jgi:DNA-directed RNA polymerase I subunit RPA1
MPKLLFVGIVERVCRATVIREIPGISECFQSRDTSKKDEEDVIKVSITSIISAF